MPRAGHGAWIIQLFGRWGSDVVLRYVRDSPAGPAGRGFGSTMYTPGCAAIADWAWPWFLCGRGHHVPAPTWEGCRVTLSVLLSCSALRLGAGVSGGCGPGVGASRWLVALGFLFPFPFAWAPTRRPALFSQVFPLVTYRSWYATCFDVLGFWLSASEASRRRDTWSCVLRRVRWLAIAGSPGRQYWGSRSCTPSADHPVPVPPTGPELSDASWCGQCTRWQVVYILMGYFSWVCSGTSVHSTRGVASFLTRCHGSRIFFFVAMVFVCCWLNVTHSAPGATHEHDCLQCVCPLRRVCQERLLGKLKEQDFYFSSDSSALCVKLEI